MNGVPNRLVIDAGPLVALFDPRDSDHALAGRGFQQLNAVRARLVAPVPIVFEVHKWLLYERGPTFAREAIGRMRQTLAFVFLDEQQLMEVTRVMASMPGWEGSMEDALVAVTAMAGSVPLWTLNYRDLGAFSKLTFWTPI